MSQNPRVGFLLFAAFVALARRLAKADGDLLCSWVLSPGPIEAGLTTGADLYLVLSGASCRGESLWECVLLRGFSGV